MSRHSDILPFSPSAWLTGSVSALPLAEQGLFLHLCFIHRTTGCSFGINTAALALRFGVAEDWIMDSLATFERTGILDQLEGAFSIDWVADVILSERCEHVEDAARKRYADAPSTRPTMEQVQALAQTTGIPAQEAEAFYHHYEAQNWIAGNGQPIGKWQSKLIGWGIKARAEASKDRKTGQPIQDGTAERDKVNVKRSVRSELGLERQSSDHVDWHEAYGRMIRKHGEQHSDVIRSAIDYLRQMYGEK
jgi:hypothetical protein